MSLPICPRCKKENKEDADTCKSCGFPINKNKNKNKMPKGLVVITLIFVITFTYYNTVYVKTHNAETSATIQTGKLINKETFGETWAFTVNSGYIYSKKKSAIFKTNGVEYGINEEAIKSGYADIRKSGLWKENDKIIGSRMDMSPFIELALSNEIK